MNVNEDKVRQLLAAHIGWDNHGCMPLRPDDYRFLPQLQRYKDSGYDVVLLNVGFDLMSIENNFRVIATFRHFLRENAEQFTQIESVADIQQAKSTGKLAVGFNLEGFNALGGQASLVPIYYQLGVRWMLIAYNRNNLAGGGCQEEDPGLSEFGRKAIDEMARVGMLTCCAHTGYRTALDVMDYSDNPVILSHSNPRALVDHPRCVPDEVMQACAKTGGVMGITGVAIFLDDPEANPAKIAEHIDYAVQLIGPEHVGLGIDSCFDQSELDELAETHPEIWPADMSYGTGMVIAGPEVLPGIVENLLARGYAEADIAAIMGGNFMRVARQVWKSPAAQ